MIQAANHITFILITGDHQVHCPSQDDPDKSSHANKSFKIFRAKQGGEAASPLRRNTSSNKLAADEDESYDSNLIVISTIEDGHNSGRSTILKADDADDCNEWTSILLVHHCLVLK